MPTVKTLQALAIASAAALMLTACASDDPPEKESKPAATATRTPTATESTTEPASTATTSAAATGVTLDEAWVRASDKNMTGMFGTLKNGTGQDIQIVEAISPAAGTVELHEFVTENGKQIMRKAATGFAIPAGGSLKLEPGHNHIMLMNMPKPAKVGDSVTVTLRTQDGQTFTVSGAVRAAAAGGESYAPTATPGMPMPTTTTP